MKRLRFSLILFFAFAPGLLLAQDCKLKFAVAYNDGSGMQIGLTNDQKKFWEHEGQKKFKSMCLDPKEPAFVIVWSEGLSGAELAKAGIDRFNELRTNAPSTSGVTSGTFAVRPSSQIRERADYVILDLSKTPVTSIRQGEGYQDVPQGSLNQPGQKVKTSDVASTIADPTAALENALKWLKKEKKL